MTTPHSADALKQQCRTEFEAWAQAEGNPTGRYTDGEYVSPTCYHWLAWQSAWNRRPTLASDLCADLNAERINTTPTSPDLVELRAKAEAAGSEAWNDEADADGYVFGSDGASVCICHANMGHMPEPIYPEHRAAFIAAANPAAILALLDRLERAEADAKHYSMGADAEAKSADEWRERALRAEAAAGAVKGNQITLLDRCAAARDGDCNHDLCPQARDGEPHKTGRHCPLDTLEDDE